MQKNDLYKINKPEIGLLGVSAGAFAVVLASGGAYAIITQWFNLRFSVPWGSFALGVVLLRAGDGLGFRLGKKLNNPTNYDQEFRRELVITEHWL